MYLTNDGVVFNNHLDFALMLMKEDKNKEKTRSN